MILRQLFDADSSTYSYLLGCETTGCAVLIDPVLERLDRDLQTLADLGLRLAVTLDTHVHADHLSAARALRSVTGCRIGHPALDGVPFADIALHEGVPLALGELVLQPLHTPGHTANHHSYLLADGARRLLFSGDSLLIEGCGRTDFQGGSSAAMFASVRDKLFALPDATLVYPGHDYRGRNLSTIGHEKACNPRLGLDKSGDDFARIMAGLNLPHPKRMHEAVPANLGQGAVAEPA